MPEIILTVDVVMFCLKDGGLHVALYKRKKDPFIDQFTLPGGFIHVNEDATAFEAALRMLVEKTGVNSPYLEQLATYSGAHRDPRGWSASIVYYAMVPLEVLEASPPSEMKLVPVDTIRSLPFDHKDIVETAVRRVRSKSTYSSLPIHLCGQAFTLPELQTVYEAVIGEPRNKVSFRNKMKEMDAIEKIEGEFESGKPNRHAAYYRLKPEFTQNLSMVSRPIGA